MIAQCGRQADSVQHRSHARDCQSSDTKGTQQQWCPSNLLMASYVSEHMYRAKPHKV